MDKAHKDKISKALKGNHRSAATKAKISKSMKGHSNFEGKHHDRSTKKELKVERGHDDRVDGRRWRTNKHTSEESRTYSKGDPKKYRWGRALGEWLEEYMQEDHGNSSEYFYVTFVSRDDDSNYAIGEVYLKDNTWHEKLITGTLRRKHVDTEYHDELPNFGENTYHKTHGVNGVMKFIQRALGYEYQVDGPFQSEQEAADHIGVSLHEAKSEKDTIKVPTQKPRNPFVAGVVQRKGAGKHLDKKREQKRRHIEELSTEKLAQYKKKAGEEASKADKEGDFKKGDKRFRGIVKATKKQFDNDAKK